MRDDVYVYMREAVAVRYASCLRRTCNWFIQHVVPEDLFAAGPPVPFRCLALSPGQPSLNAVGTSLLISLHPGSPMAGIQVQSNISCLPLSFFPL
jgi:hypothetical protein